MERQKFEGSWKEAFDQAEVNPSENVWTNVELEIERSKGRKLQRKLVFFQLLAAASAVFAIGLSIGVFVLNQDSGKAMDQIAAQLTPAIENMQGTSTADVQDTDPSPAQQLAGTTNKQENPVQGGLQQRRESSARHINTVPTAATAALDDQHQTISADQQDTEEFYSAVLNQRTLPAIAANKKVELTIVKPEEDPVAMMMARLYQRELEVKEAKEEKDRKKNKNEKLWTALGFAAGSFNAVNTSSGVSTASASNRALFNSSNSADLATKTSIANQQAKASGIAYSAGVSIGTKLAKRWVLQGGVNYLTQSSDYTSQSAVTSDDFVTFKPATINEFKDMAEGDPAPTEKLVTTVAHNVNNNLRYLSIPVQAGYLVINKQFGLQLNGGIAADLFLQNTVLSNVDNMERSTRQRGDDSPYRSVNLSGLAGTEISYKFGQHYRVAVNPGLRYPFNTIYKSEIGVESTPLTFDVGVRLRYIFN